METIAFEGQSATVRQKFEAAGLAGEAALIRIEAPGPPIPANIGSTRPCAAAQEPALAAQ
jgi:hypothetical protein